MDKTQSCSPSVYETTQPITPEQASDHSRDDKSAAEDEVDIPPVLPPDNLVLAQVRDVGDTGLAAGLENHPANVCPPESSVRIIRIEVRVRVAVVRAVTTRPPLDRALDGTCTRDGEEVLEGLGGVVGTMSPEAMVPGGNAWQKERNRAWASRGGAGAKLLRWGHTETSDEIINYTPDESSPPQLDIEEAPDGDCGSDGEDVEGNPVDVLEEVLPGDGWELLLVLEGPGDVVVGDVGVLWDNVLLLAGGDAVAIGFAAGGGGGCGGLCTVCHVGRGVLRVWTTEDMAVDEERSGRKERGEEAWQKAKRGITFYRAVPF